MATKKNQVFMVIGYKQTGSGTLTYPEDFDIQGVFTTRGDATKHAKKLNNEAQKDEYYDSEESMEYEVETLDVLTAKVPKKK